MFDTLRGLLQVLMIGASRTSTIDQVEILHQLKLPCSVRKVQDLGIDEPSPRALASRSTYAVLNEIHFLATMICPSRQRSLCQCESIVIS